MTTSDADTPLTAEEVVRRIKWRHEDCDASSCVATMELGCEPTVLLATLDATRAAPGEALREAAELADFIEHGIAWIERGPSGMSIADAERLSDLNDKLIAALASPALAEGLDVKRLAEALWAWGYDTTGPVVRDEVKGPTDSQRRMARKLAAEYARLRDAPR